LQTYNRGFRQTVDEIFNINIVTEAGRNGKNGVLFVDDAGKRNGNAVLADAFENKVFMEKYWVDAKVKEALAKAASEAYTDLPDTSHERVLATLNAYYNLFPSDEENEAGLYDYLTRGEYLSGLYRVFNGVQDGLLDAESVSTKVGGKTSHTRFLPSVEGVSYLKTTNYSLDDKTYKGAISRAEGVYTIVQALFVNEYEIATEKMQSYDDAKSGGDLTTKLGFTGKERAESYTLAYMLKNPDKGIQEELYRALVVAKEQGIITSNESRWDEPLTKGEALDMIVNGLIAKSRLTGYAINKEYGDMVVAVAPEDETPQGNGSVVDNSIVDEIGVVAIDPNTRPSDVHDDTYGQIWQYVDESYRESLRAGMSKKEALEMADVFASLFLTSLEDLNKLKGYNEIGYQRPVATKPSTPSTPKPSNPSVPSTPSTPPPVVESEPKYPISEHGYEITPEDKDGNGRLDFLEESYANTDSTVSVPSGTENPLTMP